MAAILSPQRMRILLISVNRCTTPEPVFPLGLVYLNAALRRASHEVRWLDLLFEQEKLDNLLNEFQPHVVGISIRNVDDVLISRRETFVDGLQELVSRIQRQCACPVVLGGSGFSIFPRELLQWTGADYGIVGEGEQGLVDLLEALSRKGSLEGVHGLVFREADALEINRAATQNTGTGLTLEDWPSKLVSQYVERGGMLNLQTQRGCAHRCCYCTYPVIEGKRHRSRDVEAVVAEFEQLERLGARYAFVVDSVFNSSERHVTAVCEGLLRLNLKIRWGCFLRPQGLTPEMMSLMSRAGLSHIEFGSDSFCDEVLAAYQKDFTFADVLQATDLARSEDIDFCHFVIAGGPGETTSTLDIGFQNSRRLGNAIIMAVPGMRIYPGTPLFERARAEGLLGDGLNLLQPAYYLAPGLSLEGVLHQLKAFASQAPNWIVGNFDPGYETLVQKLRQRGVAGPLWSYFAAAQRLWPEKAVDRGLRV